MDLSDLKKLSLFVDNDCWEKINTYFSKPKIKHNTAKDIFNKVKDYLKRYKINKYEFLDFCNLDLDLLEKFCDLIIRNRLRINWQALGIINSNMKEAFFKKMKLAGCGKIIFEIITGSDKLLKKMGLNFSKKDISLLLYLAQKNDISVGIKLILGFPLETDEDYNETLDFLAQNKFAINEITKISYCVSNYSKKEIFPSTFPLCRYWEKCSSLKLDEDTGFLKEDYKGYLSKISKLGIPIVNIEPSPHILDYMRDLIKSYSLERDNLYFLFENGKGRLFWKNQELTKGFGLYTSIFSSGFWQDSEHADWQIKKLSEEKMILEGRWYTLPIIQRWEIDLITDTEIIWKIEMNVLEDTTIEGEQQTNVMLKKEYETWATQDGLSVFPNSFSDEWITFFEREIDNVESISAIDPTHRLPPISLHCDKVNSGYHLSVLNTPFSFSARKLKCYKVDNKKYTPGGYLYFMGRIKIGI